MPRLLKVALVVLVLLAALPVVGAHVAALYMVHEHAEPTGARLLAEAERYWPAVAADLEAVQADPFFTAARTGGDAGERLHVILPWSGEEQPGAPARAELPLALSDELFERLRGFEPGEQQPFTPEELNRFDFSWLSELEAYGYWELSTHPRFQGGEPISGPTMPMPEYTTLVAWAKLRLFAGHLNGDLALARRQVRHLAWLSATTETLIGGMISAALLGIEEKARAAFAPDEPAAVPAREAYRRATWAVWAMRSEALPAPQRKRALDAAEGSVVLCVAIGESAFAEPFTRSLLHDYYAEAYAERDRLVEDPPPPCRAQLARRTRAFSPADADEVDEGSASVYRLLTPASAFEQVLDAVLLRPARQATGHVLFAVAAADGYKLYRDLEDAKTR